MLCGKFCRLRSDGMSGHADILQQLPSPSKGCGCMSFIIDVQHVVPITYMFCGHAVQIVACMHACMSLYHNVDKETEGVLIKVIVHACMPKGPS